MKSPLKKEQCLDEVPRSSTPEAIKKIKQKEILQSLFKLINSEDEDSLKLKRNSYPNQSSNTRNSIKMHPIKSASEQKKLLIRRMTPQGRLVVYYSYYLTLLDRIHLSQTTINTGIKVSDKI